MPASLRLLLTGLTVLTIADRAFAADEQAASYCVGTAKVDITPDYPIRLNGFGGRREESEGVSQRIYARALVIVPAGQRPLVIITIDSLGVRMSMVDEVAGRLKQEFGIPRANVALTFTHSHCTPKVNGASDNIFSQPIPPAHQEHIDRYTTELTDKIERAVRDAIKNAWYATLEWGVGQVGFAMNRRTPGGPVDHDLPVLVIRDEDLGEIQAVYVSYACHCVTLSFNQISGDWAGYAAEMIERSVPDATALVSIGCGSDSNPSSGVTGDKVELAEAQGAEIATEVSRLLKTKLRPITGQPTATLNRIKLPLNDPPTKEQLEAMVKTGGAAGYNAQTQLAKLERGEELLTAIDYPVQTFSFGEDLSIVFLAGEVCVDYSLRLKRELNAERIWFNAYSNDFCSYIPSERLVKEGGYGGGAEIPYFALPSTLRPGLEQLIVDEVKRQVPVVFHVPDGTQGVPPKSPEASLNCLQTHADLRVELVAAEPLVVDPVAIDFGPDGRLWVAEMNDYGRGVYEKFEQTGRVRWLRDNDGDGRFDEAHTFVDGLRFPTDVKVQPEGILICDAPDILLAVDTDNDGKADSVDKLFTGFEVRNAQARVNSLRLGLDNWLYGSCGLFGGNVTNPFTNKTVDVSGRDFRVHPDDGVLEAATGRSQQGRCRNDWGDWFGCTNGTLIMHYPIEDRYHRRNPLVASPRAVGVANGPDASKLIPAGELVRFELSGSPGRPTSACGLGIYRDVLLGDEYYGNAFTCEPVHQLVHRLVLEPNGVTFAGQRAATETDREFLTSTDRWFRPVQVRTGPDGAIWVVDMYRYVIEHGRWIPQEALAELDVFAGRGRGRIYRIAPADESRKLRAWPRLDKMNDEELVQQLDTPNGTVRDLAQQILVSEIRVKAVPALKQLVTKARLPQGQLHAICTLDGLGRLSTDDLLAVLKSRHHEVLRHAIRLCEGDLTDATLLQAVIDLAKHPDLRVRRQVAYTLGESNTSAAAKTLAELADAQPADSYLWAAVLSSLNSDNATAVLKAHQALPANQHHDNISQEILSIAIRLGNEGAFEQGLQAVFGDSPTGRISAKQFVALAKVLDAADRRDKSLAATLNAETAERVRNSYLSAVTVVREQKMPDELRHALVSFIARPFGSASRELLGPFAERRATGLKRVAGLISVQQSPEIQQAAIAALSRSGDAPGSLLLDRWRSVGPNSRADILDALLSREAWAKELVATLQTGMIKASQLDAARRQRLMTHANAEIREIAVELLQGRGSPSREAVVEAYRPALANNTDAERGRVVFRKSCASCHRLEEHGHIVGPDLTALTNRSPEGMLTTILDPNREVDARYIAWTAIDQQGRSMTGIIAEETSSSVRLREANGKEHTIVRADLDELRSTERSIMPEGLERDLTPQDMADVLAYVIGFDSPPKSFPGNKPRVINANDAGEFRLTAATGAIRGEAIVFEAPFANIGYWHGEKDRVAWKLEAAVGTYDVYIDWSCANDSAGNRFRIDGLADSITGVVLATGGWDRYQQRKVATTKLSAGGPLITVRPDGPLAKRALFDLREIRLVPAGNTTQFTPTTTADSPLPRYAQAIAPFLLDESQSRERRQLAIDRRPGMGPPIVSLLAADIKGDIDEEYRRVPWIWRVAIAVAKRNDGGELRDLLDVSLPRDNEPLRDWQAVVIGGGIINGVSQLGLWPDQRLAEILAGVPDAKQRWPRALQLAAKMADDENVRSGTRYDALRMIAVAGWKEQGPHLVEYLADGTPDELQMGAVSGLADIQSDEVSKPLIEALPRLSDRNGKLAMDGLLRTEQRSLALLEAVRSGQIATGLVDASALRKHQSSRVQTLAKEVLGNN
ncbi:MAG: dehydrogenase [Planctomycetaceae bacterium]|nr:dehydrogenase [Planctomycetaceae bacterium]